MYAKRLAAILSALCACHFCAAAAEPLVIVSDGNYRSNEIISLGDADSLYEISGKLFLENAKVGQESYIEIGLVPYGADGKNINEINDFPLPFENADKGYILIDSFVFDKNLLHNYARKIKLGGSELAKVSVVVGASLAKDAKLTVADLKIAPVADSQPASNSSASASLAKSYSGAFADSGKSSSDSKTELLQNESVPASERLQIGSFNAAVLPRAIYVNSEIGSDNFAGLSKTRGQADGPKRTIKSAANSASAGDFIVLQQTNTPYEVSSIRPRAGQTLKIRALGKAVLTSR